MMNGWKIGLPIAAMVFALALIGEAQIGVWQSSATGVTTSGTVAITNAGTSALSVTGGVDIGGNLTSTGSSMTIAPNTSDASDTSFLSLLGGGGSATNRGASIVILGNDHATFPGQVRIASGDAGTIEFAGTVNTTGRYNSATAQPGFLAYNSASDSDRIDGEKVEFDTEVYDTGANFSANTFTAPVTGVYQLCATVATKGASGEVSAQLVAGGALYGLGLVDGATATAFVSGCAFVPLTASQTAAIHVGVSTGTVDVHGDLSSVHQTHFSGRLVP